ncbi:D-alanyl-D-alanine carboxypeptidase family protein [Nocardia sp. CNY236]|uniref:D-alanyl-D-alanine carboxypeptidase family protein n=1 Tax=Nocardia sp. CNY236 TaxID=1169152 RepID=UPI00055B78F1
MECVRRAILCVGRVSLVVGSVLVVAFGVTTVPALGAPSETTPATAPNTDDCPHRTQPPPPIDASEVPAPGQPSPAPLSVPNPPIGGGLLGECGVALPKAAPPAPQGLSATAWLLADLDTGAVLAAKDAHGRYRPASTIKVLLAILALRSLDMDQVVVGTQDDANVEGSKVGIGPGGLYTNRQLVQALIMTSGNDAAHAIATQLGGEAATIARMNTLAQTLHASDTRAASPSGLDGPGMSTSAYDLAVLFREAMTIPLFAEVIRTEEIDFPGYPADPTTPGDSDRPGFAIGNDNRLLYTYDGALGGKTGFTDDARHTFVAAAERGGHRLVVTLLHAEAQPVRPWEQAARLLDYGFALPHEAVIGTLPGDGLAQPEAVVTTARPTSLRTAPTDVSNAHDRYADTRTLLIFGGGLVVVALLAGASRFGRKR